MAQGGKQLFIGLSIYPPARLGPHSEFCMAPFRQSHTLGARTHPSRTVRGPSGRSAGQLHCRVAAVLTFLREATANT